jgi:hypothetical protein
MGGNQGCAHTCDQNTLPAFIENCSTIGPRAKAGRKVNAATMMRVPKRRRENGKLWVGIMPLVGGSLLFIAKLPAIARAGMI